MCNHVWTNQLNYSYMIASLSLYRDLLDCIVGLNLMIKRFYDVILKPTIKSPMPVSHRQTSVQYTIMRV